VPDTFFEGCLAPVVSASARVDPEIAESMLFLKRDLLAGFEVLLCARRTALRALLGCGRRAESRRASG
jgi:hypothetical protein